MQSHCHINITKNYTCSLKPGYNMHLFSHHVVASHYHHVGGPSLTHYLMTKQVSYSLNPPQLAFSQLVLPLNWSATTLICSSPFLACGPKLVLVNPMNQTHVAYSICKPSHRLLNLSLFAIKCIMRH